MADEVKAAASEKWLAIKASDAQDILNYLGGQPCAQVYKFVGLLLQLKEVSAAMPVEVSKEPQCVDEG